MRWPILLLSLPVYVLAAEPPAAKPDTKPPADLAPCPTADDAPALTPLMKRAERSLDGRSSVAVMAMKIVTPAWTRALKLKVWTQGRDAALVRVLEGGPRETGMMTLKRDEQLWNYLPQAGRVMKLPSGMLGDSWLGSDVTNDDLVKGSSMADDFEAKLVDLGERGGKKVWHLALAPKASATAVWDKIELWVDRETCVPVEQAYSDDTGKVVRRMLLSDVKTIGWRSAPSRVTIIPADPGRRTEIVYEQQDIDIDIDPDTFSLHRLQQGK